MDVPGTKCVVKVKVEIHIAQALWVLKHPSRFWFSHSGHFGMFSKEGCFFFDFGSTLLETSFVSQGQSFNPSWGFTFQEFSSEVKCVGWQGNKWGGRKHWITQNRHSNGQLKMYPALWQEFSQKLKTFGGFSDFFEQICLKLPSIGNSLQHYKYQSLVIGTAIYKLCCSIRKL